MLPELEGVRRQPVPAPEAGPRDLLAVELRGQLAHTRLELLARSHRLALPRCERADAAFARTRDEDRGGLLRRTALHRSLHAHLPSERVPVEQQRGTGVLRELLALAARVAR